MCRRGVPLRKSGFDPVIRKALVEHQQQFLETQNGVFSVPMHILNACKLEGLLQEPVTKRFKAACDVGLQEPVANEVNMDLSEVVEQEFGDDGEIFFKVVFSRPSKKKTINVAVGAGSSLSSTHTLISLHQVLASNSDICEYLLWSGSQSSNNSCSHVISDMFGDVEAIEQNVKHWLVLGTGIAFRCCATEKMHFNDYLLMSEAITGLLVSGRSTDSMALGYTPTNELSMFSLLGLVEERGTIGNLRYF